MALRKSMINAPMRLPVGLLLAVLMITSCTTNQRDKSGNETANQSAPEDLSSDDFSKYLRSLNTLETPFFIDGNINEAPTGYDSALFVKFKHTLSSWPYGRIADDGEVVSTIEVTIGEDRFAPVLMTYTKHGQKIDSLTLHKKTGRDIDYLSKEYVTINAKKEIIVTDSTTRWELSDEMDRVDESKTTTVDTIIYRMDEQGKIVIVKGEVDRH